VWILEIGGTSRRTRGPYAGTEELPVRNSRWLAEKNRLLRFELDPSARIGTLDAIWVWVDGTTAPAGWTGI